MDNELNNEELMNMLMSGESSQGNLKEKKEPEFEKPEVEVKINKVTKQIGKYEKELVAKIKKSPEKFLVETSNGKMTLKEAMEKGWNPKTDKFDREDTSKKKEEALASLSDSDRASIERLTNPENAQIPAAEAEQFGLKEDSPMVKRPPVNLNGRKMNDDDENEKDDMEEDDEKDMKKNGADIAQMLGGIM